MTAAPAPDYATSGTSGTFLKPTKSIKPPAGAAAQATTATLASAPQVNAPTARLRRLILMPGNLGPEQMRETMLAGGQSLTPVTVVGMNAPAPVLTHLADFFGGDVTADSQKKILETVRNGMTTGATKKPGRVEVVGWMPSQGVMAVAIYPES